MKADRLLALYERVADAPGAVTHLQRFVLDLAVRGKLAEQDRNDEPATESVKRIAAERARLVKAGTIKEGGSLSLRGESLPPLPSGWLFVPLGEVVINHLGGGTPSKANESYWNGKVHWASVKDVGKSKYLDDTIDRITEAGLQNSSSNLIEPGHLIVVTRMGLGKLSINRIPVAINQDLRALFLAQEVSIDYAYNFFLTHGFEGSGLTVKGIRLEDLLRIPFPLPPLAEQHRIVAKVEELMALLDQLEAARTTREATRDRLTTASLARLTSPDTTPETFPVHARFATGALPALTTRADQIKSLRQAILNLAVQGKLVEQDPSDEPAAKLLARIAAERMRLLSAGVIPRTRELARDPTRLRDGLPSSWEPVALHEVCVLVTSGSRGWGEYYATAGPRFIRAQNLRFGTLRCDDLAHVNPPTSSEGRRTRVAMGDLLLVITGAGVTNPAMITRELGEAYVSQHVGLVRPAEPQLSRWLLLCLMADAGARVELVDLAYGAGKPGLNLDNIRSLSVPIPPLPEQHRIVAKVDELMALCNQLESALTTADTTKQRLLEALLQEALAGDTSATEAA